MKQISKNKDGVGIMRKRISSAIALGSMGVLFLSAGCVKKSLVDSSSDAQLASTTTPPGSTTTPPTINLTNQNLPGYGSTNTPVSDAVVGRLDMAMAPAAVNHTTAKSNFAAAYAQIATNLPQNVNVLLATGLDQIPLLAYAACSDVTSATAKSVYGVTFSTSPPTASNTITLVSAGQQILDMYVAGMATTGTLVPQIQTVFSNLVTADIAAGDSTTLTFLSICMAANSFGVAMRGF